jgi:hypothetical protein
MDLGIPAWLREDLTWFPKLVVPNPRGSISGSTFFQVRA